MLDKIKLCLIMWGGIFLLIFFFVTLALWVLGSIWWLVTNNMVDRNLFILTSLVTTKIISVIFLVLGLLPKKKKNTLTI